MQTRTISKPSNFAYSSLILSWFNLFSLLPFTDAVFQHVLFFPMYEKKTQATLLMLLSPSWCSASSGRRRQIADPGPRRETTAETEAVARTRHAASNWDPASPRTKAPALQVMRFWPAQFEQWLRSPGTRRGQQLSQGTAWLGIHCRPWQETGSLGRGGGSWPLELAFEKPNKTNKKH